MTDLIIDSDHANAELVGKSRVNLEMGLSILFLGKPG
jgi:hypothetical protein